jgi:hypothetical protein
MRTFIKWLAGILLVLVIGYSVGPRPSKPDFTTHEINLPSALTELETKKKKLKLPSFIYMAFQQVRQKATLCIKIWQKNLVPISISQGSQNMVLTKEIAQ